MFKPLTMSLSFAIALGASTMVLAGGHGKSMPTPQGPYPAEQVVPSEQCAPACGPVAKKKCFTMPHFSMPKIKFNHNYTYEWVLKKKHCGPLFTVSKGGHCNKGPACDSCDSGPAVYPTSQYASPQAYGTGQTYGAAQTYGSGQAYGTGQLYNGGPVGGEMAPPPPAGEEAPAGEIPPPPPGAPGASMLFLPSPTGGN